MKEWILSVVLSSLFTAVVSLILPSGKIAKTVKGVLAIFTAIVIVSPVINFNFTDFEGLFDGTNYEINYDENYIAYINTKKISVMENNCLDILENNGISGAKVMIDYDGESEVLSVKKVSLFLSAAVISDESQHIFIIDKSVEKICEYLKINRELLTVYE